MAFGRHIKAVGGGVCAHGGVALLHEGGGEGGKGGATPGHGNLPSSLTTERLVIPSCKLISPPHLQKCHVEVDGLVVEPLPVVHALHLKKEKRWSSLANAAYKVP